MHHHRNFSSSIPFLLFLALLFGLLGARTASAQTACPFTIVGTLTASDLASSGPRLQRDGNPSVCGAAKAYPGTTGGSAVRNYDLYTIANTSDAPQCVSATVVGGSTSATNTVFLMAYSSFNPNDMSAGYVADSGKASNGDAITMGLTLAPHTTVQLVVQSFNAASSDAVGYSIDVGGCSGVGTVNPAVTFTSVASAPK